VGTRHRDEQLLKKQSPPVREFFSLEGGPTLLKAGSVLMVSCAPSRMVETLVGFTGGAGPPFPPFMWCAGAGLHRVWPSTVTFPPLPACSQAIAPPSPLLCLAWWFPVRWGLNGLQWWVLGYRCGCPGARVPWRRESLLAGSFGFLLHVTPRTGTPVLSVGPHGMVCGRGYGGAATVGAGIPLRSSGGAGPPEAGQFLAGLAYLSSAHPPLEFDILSLFPIMVPTLCCISPPPPPLLFSPAPGHTTLLAFVRQL